MATPPIILSTINVFSCMMALYKQKHFSKLITTGQQSSVLSEHKTNLACDHHDDQSVNQSQPFYQLYSMK